VPNVTVIGVVTMYAISAHLGNPLYCGGVYGPDQAPWVATDASFADCGDVIGVWSGGVYRRFRARDRGPLGRYCVRWGDACLPIGADVPEYHWWAEGISARAIVTNETRVRREFERRAGR